MKNQSDDVMNYFDKMKQDNQIIVGDAFNLIKLFSIEKYNQLFIYEDIQRKWIVLQQKIGFSRTIAPVFPDPHRRKDC